MGTCCFILPRLARGTLRRFGTASGAPMSSEGDVLQQGIVLLLVRPLLSVRRVPETRPVPRGSVTDSIPSYMLLMGAYLCHVCRELISVYEGHARAFFNNSRAP